MRIFIWKACKIKGYFGICCLSFLLAGCLYSTYRQETKAITAMLPTGKKVIVLDAGHGGWDPWPYLHLEKLAICGKGRIGKSLDFKRRTRYD